MTKPADTTSNPDDDTDTWQRTRNALHRNTTAILTTWQHAQVDLDAIGFPTSTLRDGPGGGSELTTVEAAADQLTRNRAVAWIAELADLIIDLCRSSHAPDGTPWNPTNTRQPLHQAAEDLAHELPKGRHWPAGPLELVQRIDRLAATGKHWWPTRPTRGTVVAGVTIGARGNTIETCGLCNKPVTGGHNDPIRRINQVPYHGKSCWYNATRGLTYERITPRHPQTDET